MVLFSKKMTGYNKGSYQKSTTGLQRTVVMLALIFMSQYYITIDVLFCYLCKVDHLVD